MVPKVVCLLCRGMCEQFDDVLQEDEKEQMLWAIIRGEPSKEDLENIHKIKVCLICCSRLVGDDLLGCGA